MGAVSLWELAEKSIRAAPGADKDTLYAELPARGVGEGNDAEV